VAGKEAAICTVREGRRGERLRRPRVLCGGKEEDDWGHVAGLRGSTSCDQSPLAHSPWVQVVAPAHFLL